MRKLPFCCGGKRDGRLRVALAEEGMQSRVSRLGNGPTLRRLEDSEAVYFQSFTRGTATELTHPALLVLHTASQGEGISLTDNSFTGRDLESSAPSQFICSWMASHSAQVNTFISEH